MGNHKGCPYSPYLVARSLCLWDLSDDLGGSGLHPWATLVARSLCLWDLSDDLGQSGFASTGNHKGCPYGLYLVGVTLVIVECVTRDRNV